MIAAVLALAFVIALIFGLAWLLRRLPGSGLRADHGLRVIAGISLGNKERAMVVEVGGQQLLLGVTPHAISLLHPLETPLPEKAPAKRSEFASLLKARK